MGRAVGGVGVVGSITGGGNGVGGSPQSLALGAAGGHLRIAPVGGNPLPRSVCLLIAL